MKLLATSEDDVRRESRAHDARMGFISISTAGNKFITSFVRYLRLCRATMLSRAGVDYRRRCKCRCNARTTCGSRAAAPRDSSLSPAGELYRAQYYPGRTSIFRVHVKSIWSFDIPGCRSGTIASSPCHAATDRALLSGASR